MAKVTGRGSLGIDVNPVAWVFAATKVDPEPKASRLPARISEVAASVREGDTEPDNEFQRWAWSPRVLAFLRAARRTLDWRVCRTDRTLMAIILVNLHGKAGNAVSNQMRQSKSMGPDYAVRWWSERKSHPPELDPVAYFKAKTEWRYRYGTVSGAESRVVLGDARDVLPSACKIFDLLLTSPPYLGVTNYRLDNWIRLWMLGEAPLPNYETSQRYANRMIYEALMRGTLALSALLMKPGGLIYVRTDSRPLTRNLTATILHEVWPDYYLFMRAERIVRSQTHLFGTTEQKRGETDILALSRRALVPAGFEPLPADWLSPVPPANKAARTLPH